MNDVLVKYLSQEETVLKLMVYADLAIKWAQALCVKDLSVYRRLKNHFRQRNGFDGPDDVVIIKIIIPLSFSPFGFGQWYQFHNGKYTGQIFFCRGKVVVRYEYGYPYQEAVTLSTFSKTIYNLGYYKCVFAKDGYIDIY